MITSCPLCGRLYTVEVDTPPVVFDRESGEPVPICPTCTLAVDQVRTAYSEEET